MSTLENKEQYIKMLHEVEIKKLQNETVGQKKRSRTCAIVWRYVILFTAGLLKQSLEI